MRMCLGEKQETKLGHHLCTRGGESSMSAKEFRRILLVWGNIAFFFFFFF